MANKKNIRILVALFAWPPETFLSRLMKGLMAEGFDVTVACHQKPDSEFLCQKNFHWFFTPDWHKVFLPLRPFYLLFLVMKALGVSPKNFFQFYAYASLEKSWKAKVRTLFRLLPFSGKRWDLIYFPWNSAAIRYLPLFDLDIPVVLSCRGSQIHIAPHNPRRAQIREGLRETFEKAAAVHTVCQQTKKEAEVFGLNTQKAHLIYPAIDSDFFQPGSSEKKNQKTLQIVSVGALSWKKGYEYALKGMHQLLEDKIDFIYRIIGVGPDRERILFTIKDLQLEGKVILEGKQSSKQVLKILQSSDLFLHPSLSEGVPNVVLEAMACELPVVATDVGGIREVIEHENEGLWVAPRDANAIYFALKELISNPQKRAAIGAAARQGVLAKHLTLQSQSQKFADMFRVVLDNR